MRFRDRLLKISYWEGGNLVKIDFYQKKEKKKREKRKKKRKQSQKISTQKNVAELDVVGD